jgi:DnaJ-domain-containing protein 1
MNDIADPYAVLGVSRTASPDELKQAYRRLVKAWHPDRYASGSDAQRREADRRFKLINAAYVAVGEMLRERAEVQSATAQSVSERSDARVEAIRSVVASAALRVVPNLPRHTYRRVVSVVEALLIDVLAVGKRAFPLGLEAWLAEAMTFSGLGVSSAGEVRQVLDTAADDLQWRGIGADPETWQTLLRPLEALLHPVAAAPRPSPRSIGQTKPSPIPWGLLRPEPAGRLAQGALAVLCLLLLVPGLPFPLVARVGLILVALATLLYITLLWPKA